VALTTVDMLLRVFGDPQVWRASGRYLPVTRAGVLLDLAASLGDDLAP